MIKMFLGDPFFGIHEGPCIRTYILDVSIQNMEVPKTKYKEAMRHEVKKRSSL